MSDTGRGALGVKFLGICLAGLGLLGLPCIILQFIGIILFPLGVLTLIFGVGLFRLRRWARTGWITFSWFLIAILTYAHGSVITDVIKNPNPEQKPVDEILSFAGLFSPVLLFLIMVLIYLGRPKIKKLFVKGERT